MSGDVQTRQRRKEKKKQKRDEAPLPGVDTSKFNETEKKNVQMHIHESDHHGDHGSAGICAKIIFFALMAILLGLVTLIVLENRGGSDVDTPLSESRFSEYLQGWVDENREEDHHDEPHFSAPDHDDDHDDSDHAAESHHNEEHTEINDDEPYPEEKDVSNNENDDDDDNSQELNAEINSNIESNQEDENDNASPENDENDQTNDDNDNNNDGDDDDNNDQNDNEPEGTNDNDDDDNDGLEENDNNEPEVPNLFEDSAPFDEEGDDDDGIADSKDIFENVVDNDAGEDILLQKLAEESVQEQQNQQQDQDENEEEGSSSQIPEGGGAQSSYMEELLRQQALEENPVLKELYEKAKEMDITSENEKSNKKLIEAIEMYKTLIEQYGDKLNDTIFKQVGERCINRMRFLGKLKSAIDIHYKLIRRFSDEPSFRNQLAVTFLLGNRLSAAKLVLHEVLSQWRYNGFALVHYGFVLKNLDQDYENAVLYLKEGIETNEEGTQDGRFYFNLGDALQRLGRNEEAQEIYRKGAEIGLFLSEYQRSLYNVNRLKSKPFWTKLETTYKDEFTEILKYWQIIRDEGLKLLSQDGLFMNEQENLKDTGDWKQFELYARGTMTKNCQMAPITCQLIKHFKAASSCKRGQVKFSVLHPNTHVHSHCGPTNCRLRAHLGLKVPDNTFIRVANETKSWKEGEWLIFDDSYEHEVWQNGTSLRLVLIVDVWHPDLTEDEKSSMSPI